MPLPRRVVLACTSAIAPLHKGHNTGKCINEAQHPFDVFREAGFEVDLVSETGKWSEDWLSMQPDFLNGKDKEKYEDQNSELGRNQITCLRLLILIRPSTESFSHQQVTPLCPIVPTQKACKRLLSRFGFKPEWFAPYSTTQRSFLVSSIQLSGNLSFMARLSLALVRKEMNL